MFNTASMHLFTLRDVLRFAVSRFNEAELSFGHGSDNAWDEAVYLALHALHLPADHLETFLDARLMPKEVDAYVALIRQRVEKRVPAAYLTHEAFLGEFKFYVDERVIVPRSFIAELLREGLYPWIEDTASITSALDLCTGSGCLAILLASYFENARVDAVDLSPDALEVAARNIHDYGLDDRIERIESDLLSGVRRTYDLIISNPPYVDRPSMDDLPQEYRHEPTMALGSGEDGLDHTRRILADAARCLNPGGLLVVEIGHNREVLEEAYPQVPFTWLPVEAGDAFVFLLTREEIVAANLA